MSTPYRDVGLYDLTIASGAAISDASQFELGYYACSLIVPVLNTSTLVNFEVSNDGTNFYDLLNADGSAYGLTVVPASGGAFALPYEVFRGWNFVKVKVADNQSADRIFKLGGTDW